MKAKICLITVLAALLLTGCKSDDNDTTPAKPSERVQVMTVFAPSQLGDMGYADRVMKGVSSLKNTNADGVDVSFIASDNVSTTRQMLRDWAGTTSSAVDGAVYSRRLLVLTESYMVDWLVDVKSNLKETDEVLLLKVSEDDVQAAAQKLGMANRVHGLNISATESVKRFDELRKQYCRWTGLQTDSTSIELIRLYNKGVVEYRDSINETLIDLSPTHQEPDPWSIIDKAGEQYSEEYQLTAFEAAYHVCGIIHGLAWMKSDLVAGQSAFKAFVISDLGSAANGAELFLVSTNQKILVIMLLLDDESNTDMIRFAVIRHFDRALANWAQQWLEQPAASMPAMEQHGAWDGYCTDDIDTELLRGI